MNYIFVLREGLKNQTPYASASEKGSTIHSSTVAFYPNSSFYAYCNQEQNIFLLMQYLVSLVPL